MYAEGPTMLPLFLERFLKLLGGQVPLVHEQLSQTSIHSVSLAGLLWSVTRTGDFAFFGNHNQSSGDFSSSLFTSSTFAQRPRQSSRDSPLSYSRGWPAF